MGFGGGESRQSAADVETVLAEFDSRAGLLKSICDKTKELIEEFLQDADIRVQSVQARVKKRKKLREKYLDPAKSYTRLDDIHDQAGLRVVTYYEDEVDRVAEIIEREFDIDRENTVDKRKIELDRFGYSAINYVCRHLGTRTALGEYRKFSNVRFEVQVTSILSHAWSEMNHGSYDLGEASPPLIRRRFFQLKALLELAESQFLELRNKTKEYERSVAVQVEAKVPDLPLDGVSLKSLVESDPTVGQIDVAIAALLGVPLDGEAEVSVNVKIAALELAGLTTLPAVRASLGKYASGIPEFVGRCREYWGSPPDELVRGVSTFQLAMLLLHNRDREKVIEALKSLDLYPEDDPHLDAQISIAREIVNKYKDSA
jgi:ppGpp synthetase/RelA/SpoT-type nucleotidyltranferase